MEWAGSECKGHFYQPYVCGKELQTMAEEVNGIINVYKEAGFTSHDVVAKLRGILHQK